MMSPVYELQSLYRVLLDGPVAMTTFKIVVVLSMYVLIFACIIRRRVVSADRVFKRLSLSAPAKKTFHARVKGTRQLTGFFAVLYYSVV
jgi:hypothetical protein